MDKIARIRAEIERNRQAIRVLNEHTAPEQMSKTCAIFQYSDSILSELLSFLDTLSEEQDKSLEEAAEISFDEAYALTEDYRDFLAKGLTENRPRPIGPHWFCEYAKNRFIAGAEWCREQMIAKAVDATVIAGPDGDGKYLLQIFPDLMSLLAATNGGDRCKVLVFPKEDIK